MVLTNTLQHFIMRALTGSLGNQCALDIPVHGGRAGRSRARVELIRCTNPCRIMPRGPHARAHVDILSDLTISKRKEFAPSLLAGSSGLQAMPREACRPSYGRVGGVFARAREVVARDGLTVNYLFLKEIRFYPHPPRTYRHHFSIGNSCMILTTCSFSI